MGGGGHPEIHHVSIPISLHVFQAVRNEHAPMAQWSDDMPKSLMVASSNPTSATAKKTKKTVMIPFNKILGVNKISKTIYPRSAAEARRKTSSVTMLDLHEVRKIDGYRLMSRRSSDRN
jgi:hypothetical protein